MNQQGFEDYSYFAYGNETGTAKSYITAIHMENPHQIDPPFPHVIDPATACILFRVSFSREVGHFPSERWITFVRDNPGHFPSAFPGCGGDCSEWRGLSCGSRRKKEGSGGVSIG